MTDLKTLCYLSEFDIFEQIPDKELMKDAKNMHGKTFKIGEEIYNPHQESPYIYMLKRGEVTLFHSHEGRRETFDTIGPGTLFGNFNLCNEKPSHFAEASREAQVCVFKVEEFLSVLSNNPELMMKFIQSMAERLQDYEARFKNNLQTAKETIFGELSRLKTKRRKGFFGKFFGAEGPPLRLTHEQIASLTGLNRVTVTRSLKELKEEGRVMINAESGVIELQE